jgi:hypothetical protein
VAGGRGRRGANLLRQELARASANLDGIEAKLAANRSAADAVVAGAER